MKHRFLNQKLGKRMSRKAELLKTGAGAARRRETPRAKHGPGGKS